MSTTTTPERPVCDTTTLARQDSVVSNGDLTLTSSVTRQWSCPSSGELRDEEAEEAQDMETYLREAVDEDRMPENTTAMVKAKEDAAEKAKKKKAKRKLSWKDQKEIWEKVMAPTVGPRKKPKVADIF